MFRGPDYIQFELMLGRVKNLPQASLVPGQELGAICRVILNTDKPPSIQQTSRTERETVPWRPASNQVHLLLALRLFRRQVGQLIQGADIGPSGRRDDIGIGAVACDRPTILLHAH